MLLNVNRYKIILLLTTLLLFVLIAIFNSNNTNRENYEQFLLSEYSTIPDYTEEQLDAIPKPEHPHIGKFQDRFMTIDPNLGYIPIEKLHQAFIETKRLKNHNTRTINWHNVQSNMGGRTRTAMYDPNDTSRKKVWAAGVSGGLWYNNDITSNDSLWISIDDLWDNLSVTKIIYDPINSNIMYASTGEANTAIVTYRESSSKGIGIWKTIDGGSSWFLLDSTSDFEYITDIEIKINVNSTELYAGVASGIYQGQEHNSLPNDGLYKSIDGGNSWIQVLPNIQNSNTPYTPSDIEITSNGTIIIGTTKNLDGNGGATILKSNSGDLNTWNVNTQFKDIIINHNEYNIPGRIVLSSCLSAPNTIYGVVGSGFINNMGFNLSYGNYIIKSIDNGNTWFQMNLPTNEGNEWASLAWHALAIKVDPFNPEIAYIGGLELYKTLNGGDSWDNLSDWSLMYDGGGSRYVHADIHQIIFNPINNNEIIITTDGGLFYSENINDNSNNIIFFERNHGYNTLQFYTSDIGTDFNNNNDEDNFVFVGGLQDNGTLVNRGITDTDNIFDISDMITGGDGAYCFFDNDESLLITSTYYNAWYFINTNTLDYGYSYNNNGVFINPSDYDSQNNTLYANKVRFNGTQSNRIIKISNINNNSINNNDFNVSTINLNTNTSVYFSSLKKSRFSNTLFIGTQSGRLYKILDIDTNNTTIEIGDDYFPNANISSIDIGSNDNEILVTFSNYGVSSIWITYNGGTTWHEKEGNLPDMPVRYGLLHPTNINRSLIATEIGVWETSNLNDNTVNWVPTNGFPNVRVDMLSIRDEDNLVLAATHGRGLFYGHFIDENTILGDINSDNNLNVLDVVLLVNLILNNEANSNADLNYDNTLDVLDIVLLINSILEL